MDLFDDDDNVLSLTHTHNLEWMKIGKKTKTINSKWDKGSDVLMGGG